MRARGRQLRWLSALIVLSGALAACQLISGVDVVTFAEGGSDAARGVDASDATTSDVRETDADDAAAHDDALE